MPWLAQARFVEGLLGLPASADGQSAMVFRAEVGGQDFDQQVLQPIVEYQGEVGRGIRRAERTLRAHLRLGEIDLAALAGYHYDDENSWPHDAMRMLFVSNHDKNAWEGTQFEAFGPALEAAIVLSVASRGIPLIYNGQEAVSTGVIKAMKMQYDWFCSTYRDHVHALSCGVPAREVMSELFGKSTGCSKGRGGSMHLFSKEHHLLGGYAFIGEGIPVALGAAYVPARRAGHSRVA